MREEGASGLRDWLTYIYRDAGDGEHTFRRRLLGEVAVELLLVEVPSHCIQIALIRIMDERRSELAVGEMCATTETHKLSPVPS